MGCHDYKKDRQPGANEDEPNQEPEHAFAVTISFNQGFAVGILFYDEEIEVEGNSGAVIHGWELHLGPLLIRLEHGYV